MCTISEAESYALSKMENKRQKKTTSKNISPFEIFSQVCHEYYTALAAPLPVHFLNSANSQTSF